MGSDWLQPFLMYFGVRDGQVCWQIGAGVEKKERSKGKVPERSGLGLGCGRCRSGGNYAETSRSERLGSEMLLRHMRGRAGAALESSSRERPRLEMQMWASSGYKGPSKLRVADEITKEVVERERRGPPSAGTQKKQPAEQKGPSGGPKSREERASGGGSESPGQVQ